MWKYSVLREEKPHRPQTNNTELVFSSRNQIKFQIWECFLGKKFCFSACSHFLGELVRQQSRLQEKLQIHQKPVSNIPGKFLCGFFWVVPLQYNQEENLCLSGELSQKQLLPFFSIKSSGASRFVLSANKQNQHWIICCSSKLPGSTAHSSSLEREFRWMKLKDLTYSATLQTAYNSCKSLSVYQRVSAHDTLTLS